MNGDDHKYWIAFTGDEIFALAAVLLIVPEPRAALRQIRAEAHPRSLIAHIDSEALGPCISRAVAKVAAQTHVVIAVTEAAP